MPYYHPYRPNSGQHDDQGHPYGPNERQPTDGMGHNFEDRANRFSHRINETFEKRAEEWSKRADSSLSGFGASLMGVLSDALSSAGNAVSRWARGSQDLTFPEWRQRMDRKLQNGSQLGYLCMAIAGGCLAFGFGVTALVMFILSAVGPEALHLSYNEFMVFPILMGIFTPLTAGMGIMTGIGVKKFRLFGRIRGYLREAGDWVCKISSIARTTGYKPAQIQRELSRAITDGKLPGAFLDPDGNTLYFKEELFAAAQTKKAQEQTPSPQQQASGVSALDEFLQNGRNFLAYLQYCHGRLEPNADEELTEMHRNCTVILEFIQNHPEQLPRVRRFSEYYLPTTRKLLDTAQGLGQSDGENAQNIRRDINGILHTLNTAYANLYDTLLQDVSLDVSTEIDTLEAMLRQDGLAGGFSSDFGAGHTQTTDT